MSEKPDNEEVDFSEAEDTYNYELEDDDNEILGAVFAAREKEEEAQGEEKEEEKEAEEEKKPEEEEKEESEEKDSEEKKEDDDALHKEEQKKEKEAQVDEIEVDEEGVWNIPETAAIKLKVNKEEQILPFKEVVARAQKAEASDKKFQQAAAQTKQALAVVQKFAENPLETTYNYLARQFGHEKAYAHVLEAATRLVGQELEYQKLPPEERQQRQNETLLAQKEHEIKRLREEKEKSERESRAQVTAREIISECVRQGMASNVDELMKNRGDDVLEIVTIFDARQNSGKEITPAQAVSEYLKTSTDRFHSRLGALSEDELKAFGLSRSTKEQTSQPQMRKVRPRQRTSTEPAKSRKITQRGEEPIPIFSNYEEAREWARKQRAK